MPVPGVFPAEGGLEVLQFADQGAHGVVKSGDGIALGLFLAAEDVGGETQGQGGGEDVPLLVVFEVDQQMDGFGREMLEVLLQLRDLLPDFRLKLAVRAEVFADEIPSKIHRTSPQLFMSRCCRAGPVFDLLLL